MPLPSRATVALTVTLLFVSTSPEAQPATGKLRQPEGVAESAPRSTAIGRLGAVKLDANGKVATVEAFEQAIAATNKAKRPSLYGTTGRYDVDYDAVLNDALRNIPTFGGPSAIPGTLAGAAATPKVRFGADPQTQMPSSPDGAVPIFQAKLLEAARGCAAGMAGSCEARAGLDATLTSLKTGIQAHPGCTLAVAHYVKFYPDLTAPAEKAAAFDRDCLGSNEPRSMPEGYVRDPLPQILAGLSTSAGSRIPIAILELKDGKPFCGALIRNDHTLVTARHCFDDAGAAWKAGLVNVRPVDGRGGPWPIEPKFLREGGGGATTQTDWAVVRIMTTDSINATEVPLRSATGPQPAMVMGYFQDHAAVGYGPGHSADDWRLGLRWARPGFCSIEDVPPGCVRLLCQTVEGFSGAPVFVTQSGKTTVVGFISRASVATGAACGSRTSYVTVAVTPQPAF